MAKHRKPKSQLIPSDNDLPTGRAKDLPEYGELVNDMVNEVAHAATDYLRQWVGASIESGIFMNKDRVALTQSYKDLVQFDLYAEVERDSEVKAVLDSAKINVAEMPWTVDPYLRPGEKKPSLRNEAIAGFVKECFLQTGHIETTQGITSGFPQHIYNWMGALGMGFAVSEAIYTDPSTWSSQGVRFKTFLNRDPRRFQFAVKDRSLRLRTIEAPYYGEPLIEKKFVVHRCTATWDNPFGDALDQSLYWNWLFKRTGIKFWLQHLQTGTSSSPIVEHPASANKQLKDEALAIAKMIREGAYGRIPDNFKIIWAESQKGADNAQTFANFIKTMDEQISKCVNGQTLTTEAGGKTGTYAQGKVHQQTQSSRDIFRAHGFEATMNASPVRWVTDLNFKDIEGYPRFRFDLEDPEDLVRESEIIKNITGSGYQFDEAELSEKFNYTITKKATPKTLDPTEPPTDPNAEPALEPSLEGNDNATD